MIINIKSDRCSFQDFAVRQCVKPYQRSPVHIWKGHLKTVQWNAVLNVFQKKCDLFVISGFNLFIVSEWIAFMIKYCTCVDKFQVMFVCQIVISVVSMVSQRSPPIARPSADC